MTTLSSPISCKILSWGGRPSPTLHGRWAKWFLGVFVLSRRSGARNTKPLPPPPLTSLYLEGVCMRVQVCGHVCVFSKGAWKKLPSC